MMGRVSSTIVLPANPIVMVASRSPTAHHASRMKWLCLILLLGGTMAMNESTTEPLLVPADAKVEKLAGNLRFTEGPVWTKTGELVFSDIPADELKLWSVRDRSLRTFRKPSNQSNGNTLDREGRIVTCEHAARRVTRTEADGSVRILVDRFEGKRFNSPNDVVVKSDGTIWFTDPPY